MSYQAINSREISVNGPISSPIRTARLTLTSMLCAGLSVSCALAEETIFVGADEPPAVEVNMDVLDGLSDESAGTYSSIDAPAAPTTGGSTLLIEPADGYAPSLVAPVPPPTDTFALPDAIPPIPEPAPAMAAVPDVEETVVEETVVEETVVEETVVEEPVVEESVVEEPVVEETVTEEIVIEEPVVEETVATADVTDSAAIDLFPEDEDDPFAEIQGMLDDAEEAPAVEVPAPETTVEETIVANVPDATEAAAMENVQIVFSADSETLTDSDIAVLDALATDLLADESQRVQLQAYASVQGSTPSVARRLSLSRALEVRKHLIDRGVRGSRIDVRALGDKAESAPLDRVDIVMVEQ